MLYHKSNLIGSAHSPEREYGSKSSSEQLVDKNGSEPPLPPKDLFTCDALQSARCMHAVPHPSRQTMHRLENLVTERESMRLFDLGYLICSFLRCNPQVKGAGAMVTIREDRPV
jgi:hypothetical protein